MLWELLSHLSSPKTAFLICTKSILEKFKLFWQLTVLQEKSLPGVLVTLLMFPPHTRTSGIYNFVCIIGRWGLGRSCTSALTFQICLWLTYLSDSSRGQESREQTAVPVHKAALAIIAEGFLNGSL